jgi:hypothetical protein
MGIVYLGPYADDVNDPVTHEGYAARLMPDGTLTSTWGGQYGRTGHIGLIACCECGWRGETVHPPGDIDSPEHQAAERDFETQHLDPLIDAASRRSWPDWAARTTARVAFVVDHISAGHPAMAVRSLETLRDELDGRIRVATDLAAEQDRDAGEEAVEPVGDRRARPFPTVTDDPAVHTGPPPATPPPGRGLVR